MVDSINIIWLWLLLVSSNGSWWAHDSRMMSGDLVMLVEINLFWAAHQTHHSSEEYNLSTALRQSMIQQFTSWVCVLIIHWLCLWSLIMLLIIVYTLCVYTLIIDGVLLIIDYAFDHWLHTNHWLYIDHWWCVDAFDHWLCADYNFGCSHSTSQLHYLSLHQYLWFIVN